jgi:hypothetical protein
MGRDDEWDLLRERRLFNLADWEVIAVLALVEVLGEAVDTGDLIVAAEGANASAWVNFIASQVVVTNEVLAWLVYIKPVWELLSSQQKRKRITAIVGSVTFSDLNRVVSEVVVDDVRQLIMDRVKTEHLAVVVKELFLGSNFATTKTLFEVLDKLFVSFWRNWDA